MSITYVVLLALLTGTHAATWGAYKDSPFEGFRPVSFVRTITLALVGAVALAMATDLETTMAPLVFLGLIYAVERLATELWKSFLRNGEYLDQTLWTILDEDWRRSNIVWSPRVH